MRRIRHASEGEPASATTRLAGAMLVSAAIHVALLGMPGVRPGGLPREAGRVIQVTLAPVASAAHKVAGPLRSTTVAEKAPGVRESPEVVAPGTSDPMPASPELPTPAPGLPQPFDPVHYDAKDLDTYPQLRESLQPSYPPPALEQRIAGRVTLLVLIDETGKVTEASVVDATPDGSFAQPARDALQKASFLPATREGRRVRSRILVDVAFDPARP